MSQLRRLRDRVLADDIREALANDRRLRSVNARISVEVRGGVAHLEGETATPVERRILRGLVGRIRGIHAVWDRVSIRDGGELRIADIGCGNVKQYNRSLGVDRYPHPSVDVISDIECGLPFKDDSLDHVYAIHVLEHVHNLLGLMNEIHRALNADGVLHVMVPHWQSANAIADPTHVRIFHSATFKYFCQCRPGVRMYQPLSISSTDDDLFADLQPAKATVTIAEEQLARYFD